jgi:hypothetical protein
VKKDKSNPHSKHNFRLKYLALFAFGVYIPVGIILFVLRNNNAISEGTLSFRLVILIGLSILINTIVSEISDQRFSKQNQQTLYS